MSEQYRNSFLLLITAAIWGSGFVAQALGVGAVGSFTFTWARSLVGGIFLLSLLPLIDRIKADSRNKPVKAENPWKNPQLWIGGAACGTALFVSESLQQFGIERTSIANASFITSLYIVIVPVLGIFVKRRVGLNVWAAVALAVAGLYFLCVKEGDSLSIGTGDLLVTACALSFSFHILIIDYFVDKADPVRMSCLQFFTGSVIGLVMMALFDPPTVEGLKTAFFAILYAGCMSNGIAYTLQIVGQKAVNPVVASLIMSLESVFGALFGWLILDQALSLRQSLGCLAMAAAIVLAQLPRRLFRF